MYISDIKIELQAPVVERIGSLPPANYKHALGVGFKACIECKFETYTQCMLVVLQVVEFCVMNHNCTPQFGRL